MPFALKYGAVEILSLFDQELGLSTGDFAGDLNSSRTAESLPPVLNNRLVRAIVSERGNL